MQHQNSSCKYSELFIIFIDVTGQESL